LFNIFVSPFFEIRFAVSNQPAKRISKKGETGCLGLVTQDSGLAASSWAIFVPSLAGLRRVQAKWNASIRGRCG